MQQFCTDSADNKSQLLLIKAAKDRGISAGLTTAEDIAAKE